MIADPVCEKFHAHCIVVDSEEREGESVLDFPNGTETIAKVFQTGVPLISSKPEQWWKGTIFQVAIKREVQSEITAPLIHHARTVGVMQVLSYKTNAYDSHDLELIMLIARQAAVAIENARLFAAQRYEQKQTEAAAEIPPGSPSARYRSWKPAEESWQSSTTSCLRAWRAIGG